MQARPAPAPIAIAPGADLKFHPLANLFPLIEGEDFAALCASIGESGLREPIILFEGEILDGRNRYRACLQAGTEPCFEALPENTEALTYVVDRNLRRCQLNDDQRRMVAARIANLRRGRPTENSAECSIKIDEAARLVNVDKAGVKRARIVATRACAEIQNAVERGKLTVAAAVQAARLDPEKQRRIAEQADGGAVNVVRSVIKREARAVRERELGAKQRALPGSRFGFILADPERDRAVYSRDTGMDRHAANPVSSDEIT
jgi:ParB-like chromosome segregation protein Spo0J